MFSTGPDTHDCTTNDNINHRYYYSNISYVTVFAEPWSVDWLQGTGRAKAHLLVLRKFHFSGEI